jgi:signal transduction histidine kinase/CheY-like chemotaxis protein
MRGRIVTIVLCSLFAAIWAASFPLPARAEKGNDPVAVAGVLDLRSVDLAERQVDLSGEWGFYWHQLFFPNDTTRRTPDYLSFPHLWNNTLLHGKTLSPYGYATYTLTVLLPKHGTVLAMDVPDCYTSYRLFVNGRLFCSCGKPDTSEAKAVPHWLNKTIALPETSDTLFLLMQVANYWHSKGGTYKDLRIGSKKVLYLERQRELAVDFLLSGCLLMGGLFFLGLYLFGRHDKAILFFALFCIAYSYRVVGTQFYSLHTIFPTWSWYVTIRVEYLSLFLSITFLVEYVRRLYPEDVNHLAITMMNWFCLLFAACSVLTPPSVFTHTINPFLCVMFVYIAYTFYVYIQAARRRRQGSVYALLSMGVMLLTFTVLNLEYLGVIPRLQGVQFFGYTSFCFLQSLILSFRFSHDLKQSKIQAEEGAKVKSEFLSSMSHEIRTPLNSVIGMTHLLLMNETREDQKEQLNVLLFSANNLLSIVNDILDYHKIEAGKIDFEAIPIRLPELTSNIIAGFQSFAKEKNIALGLEVDPGLTEMVTGDPTRLCQVINNLVHNAIKFTNSGSVWFRVKAESRESGFVRVHFSVKDTGIGISPEKQRLVFDEFAQADSSTSRSYGGTGLGLTISQRLLSLQGSELHLRSELGKGSEFYFSLSFPIIPDAQVSIPSSLSLGQSRQKPHSTEPSVATNGATYGMAPMHSVTAPVSASEVVGMPLANLSILLVEDNPLNVLVTTKVLNRWGAHVEHAGNGKEALEKLNPLVHRLILMDMHMPVMDGYTATLRIREMGLTLPIIALTASVAKEEHKTLYAFHLDEVVTKPFHPDQLLRAILKCLRKSEEV